MTKLISIDIGQHTTKVLEADYNKDTLKIITLESFKTPIDDGQIIEQVFFEEIDKCIPLHRIRLTPLAVSVPSTAVNFTTLDLIKIPKRELEQVAIREAKRRILPRPASDDIFDYAIIGGEKIKGIPQVKVLVGAGSRNNIEKQLNLFKKKEIPVNIIQSTPLALGTYFYKSKLSIGQNWVFIDIGFKNTSMIMFNKNNVSLVRTIPFGCFDFIDEIVRKKNIEFKLAEEMFFKDEYRDGAVSDSWKYLLSELRRSFVYYKEITNGQRFDSVMLSGGMFKTTWHLDVLKSNLGGYLKVFSLADTKYIDTKTLPQDIVLSQGYLFATAVGLALSLKAEKPLTINFIPRQIIRQKKLRHIELVLLEILVGSGIILLVLNVSLSLKQQVIKMILADLNRKYSEEKYQEVVKAHRDMKTRQSSFQKQKELVDILLKKGIPHEKLFKVLKQALPDKVFIKNIAASCLKENNLVSGEITAAITADYDSSNKEIDRFFNNLKDSGFFLDISMSPFVLGEIVIADGVESNKEREYKISIKIK